MRFPYSSALLLLLSALVQYSLQQCYHHDGSIAVHDIHCTEFASDSDSAVPCCEPGRSCLPNGMCSSSATDENLMQGSCTDKSFESAHCPKFCGESQDTTIFNCTAMTGMTKQADMTAYCCAGSSSQCCDYQNLMFSAPDLVVSAKSSSSSLSTSSSSSTSSALSAAAASQSTSRSSSTSTTLSSSSLSSSSSSSSSSGSTSTTSSSVLDSTTGQSGTKTGMLTASIPSILVAAPTTTSNPSGPKRDWTGVGIGAGIGAAVPLIILVIVGLLLWRRHRRRALQKLLSSEEGASSRITKDPSIRMTRPAYLKAHEADGVPRYELETVRGAEMPVRSPRELPGSEGERCRHQTYRSGCSSNPVELG